MIRLKKVNLINILLLMIIINLFIITGCNEQNNKGNSVGAGPIIDDMNNSNKYKDKDEIINDAIRMSEEIIDKLDTMEKIESSMVFINHEAVLIALKIKYEAELDSELKKNIEEQIYEVYPEAKTIAISDNKYIYESISKLLRSYKENDRIGEFSKDLQEIIDDLK